MSCDAPSAKRPRVGAADVRSSAPTLASGGDDGAAASFSGGAAAELSRPTAIPAIAPPTTAARKEASHAVKAYLLCATRLGAGGPGTPVVHALVEASHYRVVFVCRTVERRPTREAEEEEGPVWAARCKMDREFLRARVQASEVEAGCGSPWRALQISVSTREGIARRKTRAVPSTCDSLWRVVQMPDDARRSILAWVDS